MALKSLLLYLDGGNLDQEHLELTVGLTDAHDAALTGLFVNRHTASDLPLDAPPSGILADRLIEEWNVRRSETASLFDRVTARAGIPGELRMEDGDAIHWLGLHGRCADLIVIGQSGVDDNLFGTGGVPGAVALSSGRPVLTIPRAGARSLVADRIVVGWNGSREAARAVNDAMPILQKASRVELLAVGDDADRFAGAPASHDISSHLARHGVHAKTRVMPPGETEPPEVFLSHIDRFSADLVVMGAYGRSRMREFVLGGMTRHLLSYSSVPLFLSH